MLTILLPTDFSSNSKAAIFYALALFKSQKVAFYFLHAYQNEFYDHDELISRAVFDDVLDSVRNQSIQQLEALRKEVETNYPYPNYHYYTRSAYSTLIEEANQIVQEKNIDLIVMGTKGKSDENHIVFGSHTFQVLKYVKCPVLAIPATYRSTQLKHILFPTNYMHRYKQRELTLLNTLALQHQSVIDVLYVSKHAKLSIRQEDNQAILKKELGSFDPNFYTANAGKVAQSIKKYIKNNAIDLLVMVNTQHSFLEDMLFASTIDAVSIDLAIPLLALQNSTRSITNLKETKR